MGRSSYPVPRAPAACHLCLCCVVEPVSLLFGCRRTTAHHIAGGMNAASRSFSGSSNRSDGFQSHKELSLLNGLEHSLQNERKLIDSVLRQRGTIHRAEVENRPLVSTVGSFETSGGHRINLVADEMAITRAATLHGPCGASELVPVVPTPTRATSPVLVGRTPTAANT